MHETISSNSRHLFIVGALFITVALLTPTTVAGTAKSSPDDSFIPLFDKDTSQGSDEWSPPPLPGIGQPSTVLHTASRFRKVTIDPRVMEPGQVGRGDRLFLDLFTDQSVVITVKSVSTDINGIRAIRGQARGTSSGYLVLSIGQGRVLGRIRVPQLDQELQIVHLGEGPGHVLLDIDRRQKDFLASSPPLDTPSPSPVRPTSFVPPHPKLTDSSQGITLDLLIVYTEAAREWADDNSTSIDHLINQTLQMSQQVLDNSDIDAHLNLTASRQVDYTESGCAHTDLIRLTLEDEEKPEDGDTFDSYMDEVHHWRNVHRADLVAMLADLNDYGGVAWHLTHAQGRPEFGFSVTRVRQAHSTYSFIHELGHNMGAHHHKEQLTAPGPTNWRVWTGSHWTTDYSRRYSAGWRWLGGDGNRYVSVMTYSSGAQFLDGEDGIDAPFFSDPSIVFQGAPTGHEEHADNARTLRETKLVVSNYRPLYFALSTRAGEGGSIQPESVVAEWGEEFQFEITFDEGFAVDTISGCDGYFDGEIYTTGPITSDCEVDVSFAPSAYTVAYAAGDNGSLIGQAMQSLPEGGSTSPVTAVPDEGHHFVSWCDGVETARRVDTNVTEDISVTASFSINIYSVSYMAEANGRIDGEATQLVAHGSDALSVTAVPDEGHIFLAWSDGKETPSRTDTSIAGDLMLIAHFEEEPGGLFGLSCAAASHPSRGTPSFPVALSILFALLGLRRRRSLE